MLAVGVEVVIVEQVEVLEETAGVVLARRVLAVQVRLAQQTRVVAAVEVESNAAQYETMAVQVVLV